MPRAVMSRARRSKPEVEKEFSKIVDEAAEQKENTDSKTLGACQAAPGRDTAGSRGDFRRGGCPKSV